MGRKQFNFKDIYSAEDLLDIFELPIYVRKGTWTRDFCFKIISITDRVRGESYKGGRLYDSDRTYKKNELFHVCEDPGDFLEGLRAEFNGVRTQKIEENIQ